MFLRTLLFKILDAYILFSTYYNNLRVNDFQIFVSVRIPFEKEAFGKNTSRLQNVLDIFHGSNSKVRLEVLPLLSFIVSVTRPFFPWALKWSQLAKHFHPFLGYPYAACTFMIPARVPVRHCSIVSLLTMETFCS